MDEIFLTMSNLSKPVLTRLIMFLSIGGKPYVYSEYSLIRHNSFLKNMVD